EKVGFTDEDLRPDPGVERAAAKIEIAADGAIVKAGNIGDVKARWRCDPCIKGEPAQGIGCKCILCRLAFRDAGAKRTYECGSKAYGLPCQHDGLRIRHPD